MCLAAAGSLENAYILCQRKNNVDYQQTHTLTTLTLTLQRQIGEDVYLWENLASKLLHVDVGCGNG